MADRHDGAATDGGQTPSAARLLLGAAALFTSLGAGIFVAAPALKSEPSFLEAICALGGTWGGLLVGIGLYGIIVFRRPGGDA